MDEIKISWEDLIDKPLRELFGEKSMSFDQSRFVLEMRKVIALEKIADVLNNVWDEENEELRMGAREK